MGLRTISSETRRLAKKAREKGLSVEDMEGSTFTISNLGMFGVDGFTIVIVAPQVAVLGVPAIKPTPVVVGGEVVVRQTVTVTLGTDHRAAQGAEAAQFLVELKRVLEDPHLLG
jgi:pyruvate dehydrogenase E2 component (dihydrolipoamide acetyltransferase)